MKQYIFFAILSIGALSVKAQDVITLQNGQSVTGKVAEVGINEIRYYRSNNADGPVYVLSKSDVAQITYNNKTTDVFSNVNPQVTTVPSQQAPVVVTQPQTVIVQQPVRGYNNGYGYGWPLVLGHIDLGFGHYRSYNYGHYNSGGHGRRH